MTWQLLSLLQSFDTSDLKLNWFCWYLDACRKILQFHFCKHVSFSALVFREYMYMLNERCDMSWVIAKPPTQQLSSEAATENNTLIVKGNINITVSSTGFTTAWGTWHNRIQVEYESLLHEHFFWGVGGFDTFRLTSNEDKNHHHWFTLIGGLVPGAAASAGNPKLPLPKPLLPAKPGRAQRIPKLAGRVSSMS